MLLRYYFAYELYIFRRLGYRYRTDYNRDRNDIRRRAYWKSSSHVVAHNQDSDDDGDNNDFQSHIYRTNFRDDMDDIVRK